MYQTPSHPKYPDLQPNAFFAIWKAIWAIFVAFIKQTTSYPLVTIRSQLTRDNYDKIKGLLWECESKKILGSDTNCRWVSKSFEFGIPDGDACALAGMLAAVKHPDGIITVKDSQDIQGRFWRSPRIRVEWAEGAFSRDQLMGVLYYCVATKDSSALGRYMQYLENNDWFMCPSDDGRGELRATSKANLYRVCRYLSVNVPLRWWFYTLIDGVGQIISAYCSKVGYRLELVAESVHLHRMLDCESWYDREAAHEIYRRQPSNPQFAWAANEDINIVAERVLNKWPKWGDIQEAWVWAKDTEEKVWENNPLSWSYIFICMLILQDGGDS
jgi:hypothetical protein